MNGPCFLYTQGCCVIICKAREKPSPKCIINGSYEYVPWKIQLIFFIDTNRKWRWCHYVGWVCSLDPGCLVALGAPGISCASRVAIICWMWCGLAEGTWPCWHSIQDILRTICGMIATEFIEFIYKHHCIYIYNLYIYTYYTRIIHMLLHMISIRLQSASSLGP